MEKIKELIEAMVSERDINKAKIRKQIEEDLKGLFNGVKIK